MVISNIRSQEINNVLVCRHDRIPSRQKEINGLQIRVTSPRNMYITLSRYLLNILVCAPISPSLKTSHTLFITRHTVGVMSGIREDQRRDVLWASNGRSMAVLLASHGHSMGVLWESYGRSMGVPQASCGRPMGVPRAFHGQGYGVYRDERGRLVVRGDGRGDPANSPHYRRYTTKVVGRVFTRNSIFFVTVFVVCYIFLV